MTAEYARTEWDRALEAFRSARLLAQPSRLRFTAISSRAGDGPQILDATSFCAEARGVGDYGTDVRIGAGQAAEALDASGRILRAVHSIMPATFNALPSDDEY